MAITSQWFPGSQKPWEPGVYQRKYKQTGHIAYCYWTGRRWMFANRDARRAETEDYASFAQNLPWRGVATKP